MGQIVAAVATSHILFSRRGLEQRADRVVHGMEEIAAVVRRAEPDALLMIVSDHMYNFDLRFQAPFCVAVADEFIPYGDMGIPKRPFPCHRALAETILRAAPELGFDIAKSEGITPDHGVTLPLLFLKPWGSVPVVPFYINTNTDPIPAPSRCRLLGGALRRIIETERPAAERIAVVATGGLSHWINLPGMGTVAAEFDSWVIERLAVGRVDEVAALSAKEIYEKSGNGGYEILTWIVMAAMVPESRGRKIYYEPMPEWATGMGGLAMAL